MIGPSVAARRFLPGVLAVAMAVVGAPGLSFGQESPPAGSVRARVSTCQPYNPSSCQYKTVFLMERKWCGQRATWWTPTDGRQNVQIWCGK